MQRFNLLGALIFIGSSLFAQEKARTDQSLYVVIGAFAIPRNAIEFTENVKKQNIQAEFALNPKRKLFYVYVLNTEDRKRAINEAIKLQQQSTYHDTWIYSGLLGDNPQVVKINDAERGEAIQQLAEERKEPAADQATLLVEEKIEEVKPAAEIKNTVVANPDAKSFLFRITALVDKDTLAGDIDIYDADVATRKRKSATYRGNDAVNVKPINKSGNMILECEVFGYRKLQMPTNYNTPETASGVTVEGNLVTVPFELVRLQKGDKAIMFNVYFYKDAAIMRPESRYEVNSLLEMLTENPKYKIRIHGHTNGNSAGKIMSMGDSKNFFALTTDNKEGRGSAMKLSEERALLIRKFLIANGVEPLRTEVKAWGGKQPIYDVDHNAAQANVRVEVEILED